MGFAHWNVPYFFFAPTRGRSSRQKPRGIFSLLPQGGHSHVRARGRGLWRKAPSPLDPHPKHGGRHLTPSRQYDSRPEWAANRAISSKAPRFIRPRRRFGAFSFGNPSRGRETRDEAPPLETNPQGDERRRTGERQRKEKQRVSYLHPVVLHARRCGGALI